MVKNLEFFFQGLLNAKHLAFDSMVFIYLLEQNPKYFSLVEIIFRLLEEEKISAVTSIISPLEVLSTPKLKPFPDKASLYTRFFKEETNLSVLDLNWPITEIATRLRQDFNLRTPDAIQLATAKFANASLFLTNDETFQKIPQNKDLPKILFFDKLIS